MRYALYTNGRLDMTCLSQSELSNRILRILSANNEVDIDVRPLRDNVSVTPSYLADVTRQRSIAWARQQVENKLKGIGQ